MWENDKKILLFLKLFLVIFSSFSHKPNKGKETILNFSFFPFLFPKFQINRKIIQYPWGALGLSSNTYFCGAQDQV